MITKLLPTTTLGIFCTLAANAQSQPGHTPNVPIYRVTVVDRTVSAIDYEYRRDVDFESGDRRRDDRRHRILHGPGDVHCRADRYRNRYQCGRAGGVGQRHWPCPRRQFPNRLAPSARTEQP